MRRSEGFTLRGPRTSPATLLRDTWRARDLISILARKDFFVRYRRTAFGVVWAVGLPAVQAIVIAVVFSRIVRFDVGGSYGVFVFAGILPWTFLQGTITDGSTAVVDGNAIATKVYFPRVVLPLASVLSQVFTLVPGLAVLVAAAALLNGGVGTDVFLFVPAVLLLGAFVTGAVTLFAALHVYFRDIRFVINALQRAWFYGTPVIYPLSRLEEGSVLRTLVELNPATGAIALFRAAVGFDPGSLGITLTITAVWTVVLIVAGLALHSRFDRVLVDLL